MGASWNRDRQRDVSPEGTIGTVAQSIHVAPSGLVDRVDQTNHGFAPVATACRPFGTNVLFRISFVSPRFLAFCPRTKKRHKPCDLRRF